MSLLHLQIYKTFSNLPSGIFNKLWVNLFRQSAVAVGGGEEGFFGGEGEVVGAAGDDGLAAAAVFGLAAAFPLGADMDERPAGHVIGEVIAHQRQTAVDLSEIADAQVVGFYPHQWAETVGALLEGVEPQEVATQEVGGGERGEEGRGAVDLAEPLLHDGQHAVAHRHAGQQEGGAGQGASLREEDHRGAPHQGEEAVVRRGTALEHRLRGPPEQSPQAAAVRQLLPRDELCTGAAFGLTGVRRPGDHFSVAEVEGHSALFQAAVEQQPHRFLS